MKQKFFPLLDHHSIPSSLLIISVCLLSKAIAATVTWDTSPGAVGPGDSAITGGSGTWDTTLGNWTIDAGATNIVWNNAANDTPDFTGAVGNVSLAEPVTVGGMIFANASGIYAVNGAQTITLAGSTPTFSVASGGTGYIGNINASPTAVTATPTILAGSAGTTGLTKTGGGALVLIGSAAHTYTGDTTVNGGQLAVNCVSVTSNLISSSSKLMLNGGAFSLLSAASGSSQTFNGCSLSSGHSALHVNKSSATSAGLLSLGTIARNPGATVNLFTSHNGTTTRRIQSTSWTSGQPITDSGVAYATFLNSTSSTGVANFVGNDWATYNGTTVVASTYTASTATTLSGNANIATGIDTVLSADTAITSLRHNLAETRSITIDPGFSLATGGILIGSTVAANATSISGGTLRSAATVSGKDLVVIANNSGITSIGSGIADSTAGATGLTKGGPGNLTLSGSNAYTGPTVINGGSMTSLLSAALASTPSVQVGSGSALTVSYGGPASYTNPEITTLLSKTTFVDATSGFGFDTTDATGGTANYAGGYSGSTGLAKSGSGTLVLTGANTHTGTTSVYGGTLQIANTSALGGSAQGTVVSSGAAVALNGGISITGEALSLLGDGVSQTGALRSISGNNSWSGDITLAGTARANADSGSLTLGAVGASGTLVLSGNGTITIAGLITGTAGITVEDLVGDGTSSGTMTLSGENTSTGATNVASGRLDLTGNRTSPSGAITVGISSSKTGTLNLSNGNFSTGAGNIVVGSSPAVALAAASTGVVNHSAGFLSTSGLILLGNAGTGNLDNSGNGTYHLSGGVLSTSSNNVAAICLGTNNAGTGVFNLSGTGTLEMTGTGTLQIGRSSSTTTSSTGIFNQTGGTATINNMAMGGANNASTTSQLNLTGGTFTAVGFTALAAGSGSIATINIGGSADVTLPAFPTARGAGSTANISFDGGVLRPAASSSSYMGGLDSATIQDGGLTIDVAAGRDIAISQALLTHGSSTGGGLIKLGDGILALSGVNTYTGPTLVNAGSLGLDTGAEIDASSAVTVAASATFGGVGTAAGTLASSGTISPGVPILNPVGELTTGPATLSAGALAIEVSDITADKLTSTGAVSLTGATLMVSELLAPAATTAYTIVEGASVSGVFASPSLPPGYSLAYTSNSVVLNFTAASGNYGTWATANGIGGEPATGDFDHDGIANVVEYALGLSPTLSSSSPGTMSNEGKTITFTKGADAKVNGDVIYKIETSISLGGAPTPWTESIAPEVTETADTIAITLPNGPAKNFARLKVVQTP